MKKLLSRWLVLLVLFTYEGAIADPNIYTKNAVASGNSSAAGITIGTSIITGGTDTRVLFDDAGVVGESSGLTYVKGSGTLSSTALTTGAITATGVTAISSTQLAPALTAGNWTVGAGWESPIVGPGLIKNADGTGTQTPSAATNIVANTTYKVTITLSAASVGSATYTLGGVAGASTLSAVQTYTDYVTTTTTGKLIITPTNTSRFTISAISILAVGDFNGTIGVTKPTRGIFTTLSAGGGVFTVDSSGNVGAANLVGSLVQLGSTGFILFTSRGYFDASGDGVMRIRNNSQTSNVGTLQLGTTTSLTSVTDGVVGVGTGAQGSIAGGIQLASVGLNAGHIALSATAPTLASGGCSSPTAVTSNGTAAFSVGIGTSCSGSQPLVFTLPAATTGWMCTARNSSNGATSAPAQTAAVSTTSVTITNFNRTTGVAAAWTDSDNVVVSCMGY